MRFPCGYGGHGLYYPSDSLRRARLSRPRDRMSSERRRARDGPSAHAVGQAGEPKEPDEVGRISGGGLSFGDFSLATQRKVTRPSPKGGRNPFEASGLASCTARPCHPQSPLNRADDYAYRLIDPTIARQGRACLPQARSLAGRPDATGKGGGVAAPIGPRRVPSP
ncbi:hypothetical protein D3C86_1059610 [compost metagenome]